MSRDRSREPRRGSTTWSSDRRPLLRRPAGAHVRRPGAGTSASTPGHTSAGAFARKLRGTVHPRGQRSMSGVWPTSWALPRRRILQSPCGGGGSHVVGKYFDVFPMRPRDTLHLVGTEARGGGPGSCLEGMARVQEGWQCDGNVMVMHYHRDGNVMVMHYHRDGSALPSRW